MAILTEKYVVDLSLQDFGEKKQWSAKVKQKVFCNTCKKELSLEAKYCKQRNVFFCLECDEIDVGYNICFKFVHLFSGNKNIDTHVHYRVSLEVC